MAAVLCHFTWQSAPTEHYRSPFNPAKWLIHPFLSQNRSVAGNDSNKHEAMKNKVRLAYRSTVRGFNWDSATRVLMGRYCFGLNMTRVHSASAY